MRAFLILPVLTNVLAAQTPVPVLQTGFAGGHCWSVLHFPQKFGVVTPQMLPFGFAAQSVVARQSPFVHVPARHRNGFPAPP